MEGKSVAEILQKPLQEAFDAECRSYANYLELYESLFETCKELEKQRDELDEEKKLEQKIADYNRFFNSSEFDKMKKSLNLSDSELEKFTQAFSMYSPNPTLSDELIDLHYDITSIGEILEIARKSIRNIENNVKKIIYRVHDSGVELEFSEDYPFSVRLLILCYCDDIYFIFYRKKIIKIEDCKLSDDFMKAYLSKGYDDEKEAFVWFAEEAKKYKI